MWMAPFAPGDLHLAHIEERPFGSQSAVPSVSGFPDHGTGD
jgi:hypothetical protein